ncbi:hypothetical protein PPL_02925 [Heterostelium album PN500]|uniref:Uncharacterized protein n=1 Tax=Heterostelium pallidum (strain ATCC 26659 / Pp 5 / PN500) TaxID=670386 RepID=D3B3F7_HETP5|nr:hypothetical protein PPL_02925 [Heterostelium album PN500]EFA83855.1 hypothetical protein PPL_02925 [Heterostelium album PN500]|eukprot:XP_020435972.1 hypothetical protein PPL_02925 [Heterostelium album PN500]
MNFLNKSKIEISEIVRTSKTKTLVFAYDGTRRSHLINEINKNKGTDDSLIEINWNDYSSKSFKKMIDLTIMMMKHGIHTVIYPMWFPTLGKRGPEYYPKFIKYLWGLNCLITDSRLMDIFLSLGIRIVFYGEWREFCRIGNDEELENLMESLMSKTKHCTNHLLLFGTNITSTTEIISKLSIDYFQIHNKLPSKNELIEQYYGVPVDSVDLYIGFDRFCTDGRPPIISEEGSENLYFTVSPHSYFNKKQFRSILFDHIYARSVVNSKDYELKKSDIILMNEFYNANSMSTLGCGNVQKNGYYWFPTPQTVLIDKFNATPKSSIISKSNHSILGNFKSLFKSNQGHRKITPIITNSSIIENRNNTLVVTN